MTGYNDPISYNSFINYNGVTPVVIMGGAGDGAGEDSWARYLKYLSKQKKKQFKEQAAKIGIAPSHARQISETADYQASQQKFDLQKSQEAAQQAILDLYEDVWQQLAVQKREIYDISRDIDEKRNEEEFFLLMM